METRENTPLLGKRTQHPSFASFFAAFWPLGLIAFGGPQAHVALLHDKFVSNDDPSVPSLPESTFLELYAVTMALPGPGSTQLATVLGAMFGGLGGACATFIAFQLPGFLVMTAAGMWFHGHLSGTASDSVEPILEQYTVGLVSAAFAMVVIAAMKILTKTCGTDRVKIGICVSSAAVAVLIPPSASSWVFVLLLVAGGVVTTIYDAIASRGESGPDGVGDSMVHDWDCGITPRIGAALLAVYCALTVLITLSSPTSLGGRLVKMFWRIGWTVFGGGVVVIPMLLNEIVSSGLLPPAVFLAGFGIVSCAPGPLFNLAPFIGAALLSFPGALYTTFGLFFPGLLLAVGVLPFWQQLRTQKSVQTAIKGVNCAATGLIISGVYLLLVRAVKGPLCFALSVSAGAASIVYKVPTSVNVAGHGVLGVGAVLLGLGGNTA